MCTHTTSAGGRGEAKGSRGDQEEREGGEGGEGTCNAAAGGGGAPATGENYSYFFSLLFNG